MTSRPVGFLSVCSGIEAASVAFGPLGWRAAGFAEIDRAASELLAYRYGSNMPGEPLALNGVPNHGDFTTIDVKTLGPVDVLCGGTPCQAFSIAGKRLSLADARGNLSLAFAVLAHDIHEHSAFHADGHFAEHRLMLVLFFSHGLGDAFFRFAHHVMHLDGMRLTESIQSTDGLVEPLE
jgi:hypothetical protein